jgi:hypothetical protein
MMWEDVLHEVNQQTPWIESVRQGLAVMKLGEPRRLLRWRGSRIGCAPDRATALLAALSGPVNTLREVPDGVSFRQDLSIQHLVYLDVSAETVQRLTWLGFTTLGRLVRLTQKQLELQFPEGGLLYGLAHATTVPCPAIATAWRFGTEEVHLYVPPPSIVVRLQSEPPVVEPHEIDPMLVALVRSACRKLQGAEALQTSSLTLCLVVPQSSAAGWQDGEVRLRHRRLLQRPASSVERVLMVARLLLRDLLESSAAGGAVSEIELTLAGLSPVNQVQATLWDVKPAVVQAVQGVEFRFPGRLCRIVFDAVDSLLPEEGYHMISAAPAPPTAKEKSGRRSSRRRESPSAPPVRQPWLRS